MRHFIISAAAVTGSAIAAALGGWDYGLQTLVIFMAVDYISGLALAGIFKRSANSECGGLSSKCGFTGLLRKGMQLSIVLIAHRLDVIIGVDFVRTAVIIAFIANELISIIENGGLMGIPIPEKLRKAVDVLNAK